MYKIIKGSVSCHCCFSYTIIDTNKKGDVHDQIICECFEKELAELICSVLNEQDYRKLYIGYLIGSISKEEFKEKAKEFAEDLDIDNEIEKIKREL
jgi:dTDP-4-dehydrorhamnose reductase